MLPHVDCFLKECGVPIFGFGAAMWACHIIFCGMYTYFFLISNQLEIGYKMNKKIPIYQVEKNYCLEMSKMVVGDIIP